MVNKDCGLRDQILQSLTMLDKKLESFIIIFSTLILIFKKISSTFIFHTVAAFQQYQIY